MKNIFAEAKKRMAESVRADGPFTGLSDDELVLGVVNLVLSVPTDRVQSLIEKKNRSTSKKDQYEAREMAMVLFVQQELAKMPESVSDEDGVLIIQDTLRECFRSFPQS